MYTLLSGFYKYLTQKDEYCILILGLDNAGKTTYLEAAKTKFTKNYRGMNPSKITTTVGLNIGQIDIQGIRLSFWDLGGQQELQSLRDKKRNLEELECEDMKQLHRSNETRKFYQKLNGSSKNPCAEQSITQSTHPVSAETGITRQSRRPIR